MDYASVELENITQIVEKLNALFESAKSEFDTQKKSFKEELDAIKSKMINDLVFENAKKIKNELDTKKEELQTYIIAQTAQSYEDNKEDLIKSINIDYDALLSQNATQFLALAQKQLNAALDNEFKKEKYTNILKTFEKDALNALKHTQERFNEDLIALDLKALATAYIQKQVQKDFKTLEALVLKEQKSEIAKQLLNHFLHQNATQELIKESLSAILEQNFTQKSLKEHIEARLIDINHHLVDKIMGTRELFKTNFIQNLVLASLSLKNELSLICENMDALNRLKVKEKGIEDETLHFQGKLKVE
ncbi:hypothetical protein [Campylobacter cuniculorum]|uniref:Uncharacterized protein n=2 Tax=Campylobacter cuniculorum TaxID=374106 RepID=A0A1W6BV08_9BACT|nr:hypothetical protein [Campylobacter cuniculorum]ARJ55914.1 hypothetical protein CCUN_0259 [Campylobacter cuniculorum DSM 23162 = LMG 24588]QOR05132.1 hypothetical protein A0071_04165 [Campylobacter cuniculorum]